MRIADILRAKGSAVATVTETTTVTALLADLAVQNIGAMVVIGTPPDSGGTCVVGIVSERDVVRRLHEQGADLLNKHVAEIMSGEVLTCSPDAHVDDLAAMMTNRRIRHVPVLDGGRLAGIVSIGDVVKSRMEELEAEQDQLQAYIRQSG